MIYNRPLQRHVLQSSKSNVIVEELAKRRKRRRESFKKLIEDSEDSEESEAEKVTTLKVKKVRKQVTHREANGEWDDIEERFVTSDPKMSKWYIDYVASDKYDRIPRLKRKFRARFRLPRSSFIELVALARFNNWFPKCEKKDAVGKVGVPLELLILGALRYLGRGWTFDDLEEATGISVATHRNFFHQFINIGATELFERWVKIPESEQEIADSMKEYAEAGFHGCIGSSDATHIIMERCSARLKNHNLGGKDSHTTRAFNMVVNHKRKILHTTVGFPGRWNDKSIVFFDGMLRSMKEGKILQDVEYSLFVDGKPMKYKGAYVIVDNGNLKWQCTIPPFKETLSMEELRWSRWLESMRKDVECTFGILKGRWRILKTGIRLHSFESVDNIWKTCCALHNWLLEVDGLHKEWKNGIPSDFEGELGYHDVNDADRTVPLILARIGTARHEDFTIVDRIFGNREHDASGMGIGNGYISNFKDDDDILVVAESEEPTTKQTCLLRNTSYKVFRDRLVKHFSYLWNRRAVKWPSRTGKVEWTLKK